MNGLGAAIGAVSYTATTAVMQLKLAIDASGSTRSVQPGDDLGPPGLPAPRRESCVVPGLSAGTRIETCVENGSWPGFLCFTYPADRPGQPTEKRLFHSKPGEDSQPEIVRGCPWWEPDVPQSDPSPA